MNSKNRLRRVEEDADDDDDDDDDYDDYEGILNGGLAEFRLLFLCEGRESRRTESNECTALFIDLLLLYRRRRGRSREVCGNRSDL